MLPIIEEKRAELAALCREYQVVKLEVFGSAVTDEFDAERSDIDFIVHYAPDADLGPVMGRHFALERAMSDLLSRSVDLVLPKALEDPFFHRVAVLTRRTVLDEADLRPAA